MFQTLGEMGRISHVHSDGDLRVKVAGRIWLFSSVCCNPIDDPARTKNVPELTDEDVAVETDDLKRMQRDMART